MGYLKRYSFPPSDAHTYQPAVDNPGAGLRRPFSQIRSLIARDGLKCHWCGKLCDPTEHANTDLFPTKEHLIRKRDGGSNHMSNLVIACRKCNNERG